MRPGTGSHAKDTLAFELAQCDIISGRPHLRRFASAPWDAFRVKNLLPSLFGEATMPQYVIEREIPGAGNLSDAELQAVARKTVGVLKELGPDIKWLHSYVTGDKVYCVYLAPDEETVREHARRGGFPANRISAVRRMIDPGTAN